MVSARPQILLSPLRLVVGGVLVSLLSGTVSAQPDLPISPSEWRPEIVSPPGVDAKGDLTLSIPVVTVPGLGGMSFPIVLNYTSGTPGVSNNSWLWRGWRFDPGSITREIYGGERRVEAGEVVRGGDVVTDANSEQWIVSYVDDIGIAPPFQPDRRTITLPTGGASFSSARSKGWRVAPLYNRDFSGGIPSEIPSVNTGSGAIEYQTGFRLDGSTIDPRPDVSGYVVTTNDGTRYVFGRPAINAMTVTTGLAVNLNDPVSYRQYVHSWGLVAILGPNTKSSGDRPSDLTPSIWSRTGEWIVLDQVLQQEPTVGVPNIPMVRQDRKYTRIITPTHCAVLTQGAPVWVTLIVRDDDAFNEALDTPCSGPVVRRVRHSPSAIQYEGTDGEVLPGYQFTYHDLGGVGEDDFGMPTNEDGMLKTMTLPTGGIVEIEYEPDEVARGQVLPYGMYDIVPYAPGSGSSGWRPSYGQDTWSPGAYPLSDPPYEPLLRGGMRVQSIRVSSEDSETPVGPGVSTLTTYEYPSDPNNDNPSVPSGGFVSAIPDKHWKVQGSEWFFVHQVANRLGASVYYDWVSEVVEGQGYTKTYYSTSNNSNVVRPRSLRWRFFSTPSYTHSMLVAQEQGIGEWGKPIRTERYNEDGCLVQTVERGFPRSGIVAPGRVWPGGEYNLNGQTTLLVPLDGRREAPRQATGESVTTYDCP